mmetsp:Transcript_41196/g.101332  ORF Transcript_41196/g.101332 Transcript_41196/m.101332 type:complete len:121 (+) Transcript_41196:47-409(+)
MGAAQYEVLYELDATGNAEAIALMEKVPTGAARNVAEGFSIRAEGTVSGGVFAVTAGSMTRASASDGSSGVCGGGGCGSSTTQSEMTNSYPATTAMATITLAAATTRRWKRRAIGGKRRC